MKKIMFNDRYGLTDAVLDGRKTMTRRIVKCPREINGESVYIMSADRNPETNEIIGCSALNDEGWILDTFSRKYKIGEVVAVAQSYRDIANCGTVDMDSLVEKPGYKNKMFVAAELMPYKVRITNIRVEQLQDISDEDCIREGIIPNFRLQSMSMRYYMPNHPTLDFIHPREAFASLIDRISGKGTWDKNPLVFVYNFELVK